MKCKSCYSENIQIFKEGEFTTAWFCNDCGNGAIDYFMNSCCGLPDLTNIRFEQSNSVIVQRIACRNCRALIGGAKKKSSDFSTLRLYSQKAYLLHQEKLTLSNNKMREYIDQLRETFRATQQDLWWEKYNAYLKTNKWKGKRLQVLERENGICQGCHYSKAIHIHHTTYENLGDELLFQLVALCKDCHSKLHPEKSL